MFTLGNKEILKLHKTAFLCSRKYPSAIVLKAYDWATAQREAGNCVISGFHSQIEKDMFHFLLKGTQPIILALARGLPKRITPELSSNIEKGRLVLITPFTEGAVRITAHNAYKRNEMMVDIADRVVIGYATEDGSLAGLIKQIPEKVGFLQEI